MQFFSYRCRGTRAHESTCVFTRACIMYKWVRWNSESWLDYINWYTSNAQRLLFPTACNQWVNYIIFFDLLRLPRTSSLYCFIRTLIWKNCSINLREIKNFNLLNVYFTLLWSLNFYHFYTSISRLFISRIYWTKDWYENSCTYIPRIVLSDFA